MAPAIGDFARLSVRLLPVDLLPSGPAFSVVHRGGNLAVYDICPLRRKTLQAWIGSAMNASEQGKELNFPIIDDATRSAVGTTSFFRVVPSEHKRIEMGKTWLGAPLSQDAHQYSSEVFDDQPRIRNTLSEQS